ncbi:hypothetical protein EBS40_04130 [bacterium]|nr:hypothetical protein [bacterium]
MLKTVAKSANRKTGPIAVTYRAGVHETYATCPSTCALHPKGEKGGDLIDGDYLDALREAVPAGGIAWTYSHFDASLLPQWAEGETVINASCDTVGEALRAVKLGRPAVYVAPADTATSWPAKHGGIRFIRCPAELADNFTCDNCGGDRPLCARAERDYVVVFVAHGASKAKIGKGGGCYAAGGPTAIQWHGTRTKGAANDAQALRAFAASLPQGSKLRHHVAGDLGLAT